jgi:hypothetical protein
VQDREHFVLDGRARTQVDALAAHEPGIALGRHAFRFSERDVGAALSAGGEEDRCAESPIANLLLGLIQLDPVLLAVAVPPGRPLAGFFHGHASLGHR